jgi:hypothetical protein
MQVQDVTDLLLEDTQVPTRLTLKNTRNVTVRQSRTPTLEVSGAGSHEIRVTDTVGALSAGPEVSKDAIVRR